MRVIAATTNEKKLEEIRRILSPLGIEVLRPPRKLEVEEYGTTFVGNAYLKAKAYYEAFGIPSLADDSGLVAEAIAPYPGVYSSRFHSIDFGGREEGEGSQDEKNIRKLLRLLRNSPNRRAKFLCAVILYLGEKALLAEGQVAGTISENPRGSGGFGYDPVFIPEGYDRTMAELSPEEKDRISHRGRALWNLYELLKKCEEIKG
ncbi:MAG: RdgB/HAM1 family non-canonical purine NTP pyrophosphatase [Aquificae bacterium]|nr:RdgB/HAM1 family non-canonical purine NTP pyrophosphatase [Aquificota bacterium]